MAVIKYSVFQKSFRWILTIHSCLWVCSQGDYIKRGLFQRQSLFDDKSSDAFLISNEAGRSNVHCGKTCLKLPLCASYFYNHIKKNCTLTSGTLTDISGTAYDQGRRYYILQNQDDLTTTAYLPTTTVMETTLPSTTIAGVTCPPDYVALPLIPSPNFLCVKYYDITIGKDYDGRKAICEADGGNLVKIDTATKQTALSIYLRTFVTDTNIRIVIQGQEELPSGIWKFDDGTQITYTYWRNGQPNSASDNCVAIRHIDYEWRDIDCTMDAACVCEIELS